MRNKRFVQTLICVIFTFWLTGCISLEKYPSNWANPSTIDSNKEYLISGSYQCEESEPSSFSLYLPYVLKMKEYNQPICDILIIRQNEPDSFEISAYNNHLLVLQRTYRVEDDYKINNGWVILNGIGEGGLNRGGVIGFAIDRTSITRNEAEDLIIKKAGGGAALFFFIPVIGAGRSYHIFRKSEAY